MFKILAVIAMAAFASSAFAAELTFDFSKFSLNTSPTGFVSKVNGASQPGDWKIIEDEIPSAFAPLTPNAPKAAKRFVLAQLSQDKVDERFPMLIFDRETFGNFTVSTQFKCVSGSIDQMAGIAFRVQDANNYYIVRASSLGNTFRFYKVVNGERSPPIGPQIPIPGGVWHQMSVECKGNQIRCLLNGKEVIPMLTDNSFSSGKIAFWTKSDSVSYFVDTKIVYTPRVPLAQTIVRDTMKKYPRLIGLKIFSTNNANGLRVIGSSDEQQIGEPGAKAEEDVLAQGQPFLAKTKDTVSVILPLKDRNGDSVAVLRVIMKPFPGQTESNVLARALPIVKTIEARIVSAKDLTQ